MEKIQFTKYSNERASRFAIRTDIIEENGIRTVRKQACAADGRAHIENIYDAYVRPEKLFQKTEMAVNVCERLSDGNGVRLEFLEGKTLQEVLDKLLETGKTAEFKGILKQYVEMIDQTASERFVVTEEFREVFGEIEEKEKFRSAPVTDIDMVLSNVFVSEKQDWTLIDYEWTFTFPIPIQFVLYRVLHYYEYGNLSRNRISEWDLYKMAGITEEEKAIFSKMEERFQDYVLGGYVPARMLYPSISLGRTDMGTLLDKVKEEEKVQVFFSKDGLVREEDSRFYPLEKGFARIALEIEEGISSIRLDPGEKAGKITVRKLEWDGGDSCRFEANGMLESEHEILFLEDDPQICIREIPKGKKTLYVELYKDLRLDSYARQILKDRKELKKLRKQVREQKETIAPMESTKVWKTYKKYKTMIKGERD